MDQYYDQNAACALLVQTNAERTKQNPKDLNLTQYSKTTALPATADDGEEPEELYPIQLARPRCWKLVTVADDEGVQEEMVLRLQGIICDQNLPPIRKPQNIALRERRYRRQSIMLTGFSADLMQTYIKAIQAIFHMFERVLPVDSLEKWVSSLFDGHVAIDMGNRFFTDRLDQANHEVVPFKHSVDPDGILERAMGTDFVHLRENEVEYFECVDNGKGEKKYNVIEPWKLNKGDIVEAQVSFLVVPFKGKRFKPLIVMRAITLLDGSLSKDAFLKRRQSKQTGERKLFKQPMLKRRVGYIDDNNEESTERHMKRMTLSDISMESIMDPHIS